jgi:tetratricopeptide (TPR) repeat protein
MLWHISLMVYYSQRKLGMALLVTSFHMSSYSQARGKDAGLTPKQANEQGVDMTKEAIKIFQKLGDGERLAEAYMVLGLHVNSSDPAQLEYLQKGLSLCLRVCGRYHMLSARFHINIGIYYEDTGDYVRAYEYFKDWAEICTEVYGPSHPKTKRAKGTLLEPRYLNIANQLAS